MTPNKNPHEIILKTPPRKSQERAPKITKGETLETTQGLEEPRGIMYTYHEGPYKV
jgi:hypothetical protein